jgi:hypothetical protein
MRAIKPDPNEYVLSEYPVRTTVGDVRTLLSQGDENAKGRLIDIIYHRLNRRYLLPMSHIPLTYKSGFLMMASACLLIEALQSFREGREYTKERGAGEACFRKFFTEIDGFQPFAPHAHDFYVNVRCGILHQAETYQGWGIRRDKGGPLFDPKSKVINANSFLNALSRSLEQYCDGLRSANGNSLQWKAAKTKLAFICNHCAAGHP